MKQFKLFNGSYSIESANTWLFDNKGKIEVISWDIQHSVWGIQLTIFYEEIVHKQELVGFQRPNLGF